MRIISRVSDERVDAIRGRRAERATLDQLALEFAPISRSTIYQIIEGKGPYTDHAPVQVPREVPFGLPKHLQEWKAQQEEKRLQAVPERSLLLSEELALLQTKLGELITRVRVMEAEEEH